MAAPPQGKPDPWKLRVAFAVTFSLSFLALTALGAAWSFPHRYAPPAKDFDTSFMGSLAAGNGTPLAVLWGNSTDETFNGTPITVQDLSFFSERFEGVDCRELGDPRVAELRGVGRRLPNEGGEQLLMRRGPRYRLDADTDPGILTLEVGDELLQDFAFGAEGPEAERRGGVACGCAGEQEEQGSGKPPAHCNHPPVNPARSRPRRMYGLWRMRCQTSPVR